MKVAVSWQMCGYVDIPNAKNVEEAIAIFKEESDYIKIPTNGEYVESSFELSSDDPEEQEAMCNL